MLLLADTQARLRHIVAVWHRCCQRFAVPGQAGVDFFAHRLQRNVIHRQVMEQQDANHPVVRGITGIHQAQQRRLTDIETITPRVETLVQLIDDRATGRIKFDLLHRQNRLAPNDLNRRRQPFPNHRRTQNVVPRHDLTQRSGKGLDPLEAVERQQRLQQIRIALRSGDVVIENAFLQRCQRIDILHIGGTARHGRDDTLDHRLIQFNQWQQVRRDVRAIGRNAVSRHLDFAAAALCRR
ncbi:hypothetical protein D3C81_1083680 [compost metagenome]